MDRYLNYKCVLILILIKCVYCSDKPDNLHTGPIVSCDSDEDNFEVTETEQSCHEEEQDFTNPIDVNEESDSSFESTENLETEVPDLNTLMLYRLDEKGNIFPMDVSCYYIKTYDSYGFKFVLTKLIEKIEFNGQTIWIHEPGMDYPLSFSYKIKFVRFALSFNEEILSISYDSGNWTRKTYPIPKELKFYTQNEDGENVIINRNDYIVDYTTYGNIKFTFMEKAQCKSIYYGDIRIWVHKDGTDKIKALAYYNPFKFIFIIGTKLYLGLLINGEIIIKRDSKLRRRQFKIF
ncbi:Theileria-specific sub-telomeric protein, SVSP family, putative [Theileria annulata]|uniref:Theileria-specific sub-telomeric protein, SVSP family, putative n=1 Tax=Theileria annulata TaxID=5874 RepID=Q4UD81_THEAN|nr:Theileria-specific sub-telomeric protein, SVSP family, putative [Theileria annulata]CAI74958.1 Theileria-specific sub-telomeric protein, SVSP family, putative [Theileria annulata]|eukprot:XP_952690.1 Theileria-specific sub-telomeric protein, SVSP family, putative [Theileria annulata]